MLGIEWAQSTFISELILLFWVWITQNLPSLCSFSLKFFFKGYFDYFCFFAKREKDYTTVLGCIHRILGEVPKCPSSVVVSSFKLWENGFFLSSLISMVLTLSHQWLNSWIILLNLSLVLHKQCQKFCFVFFLNFTNASIDIEFECWNATIGFVIYGFLYLNLFETISDTVPWWKNIRFHVVPQIVNWSTNKNSQQNSV